MSRVAAGDPDITVQFALPLTIRIENELSSESGARADLRRRFGERMRIDPAINRRMVSYQSNRPTPGLRWFKYKEAFSAQLVRYLLSQVGGVHLLDPFSGIGTAPLTASGVGFRSTGIEVMPVGRLVTRGITAAIGVDRGQLADVSRRMLDMVGSDAPFDERFLFKHVPITREAFPPDTERGIGRANAFLDQVEDPRLVTMLRLACMSVLESVSYTSKDGQFLRWDERSGRPVRSRMRKKAILGFREALGAQLGMMIEDVDPVRELFGGPHLPAILEGSCLERLRDLETGSVDVVVTSPPYANRYDYTRTYALELAYLGYGREGFLALRQDLLTATVENLSKREWLSASYGDSPILREALEAHAREDALTEVLDALREQKEGLSNPRVIRLVDNYFLEMAVVVDELARVVRPGGTAFVINDNVQYHGQEVPVDLMLSSLAEKTGFRCERIWALYRGKGNAGQQMGRWGRREIRKCVYQWVRP